VRVEALTRNRESRGRSGRSGLPRSLCRPGLVGWHGHIEPGLSFCGEFCQLRGGPYGLIVSRTVDCQTNPGRDRLGGDRSPAVGHALLPHSTSSYHPSGGATGETCRRTADTQREIIRDRSCSLESPGAACIAGSSSPGGKHGPDRHHLLNQLRGADLRLGGSGSHPAENLAHRDDIVSACSPPHAAGPPACKTKNLYVAATAPACVRSRPLAWPGRWEKKCRVRRCGPASAGRGADALTGVHCSGRAMARSLGARSHPTIGRGNGYSQYP